MCARCIKSTIERWQRCGDVDPKWFAFAAGILKHDDFPAFQYDPVAVKACQELSEYAKHALKTLHAERALIAAGDDE